MLNAWLHVRVINFRIIIIIILKTWNILVLNVRQQLQRLCSVSSGACNLCDGVCSRWRPHDAHSHRRVQWTAECVLRWLRRPRSQVSTRPQDCLSVSLSCVTVMPSFHIFRVMFALVCYVDFVHRRQPSFMSCLLKFMLLLMVSSAHIPSRILN